MKQLVTVFAKHTVDGKVMPVSIIWCDGREFEIDKITDIRQAASLKSGGIGIRYTCRIKNIVYHLFDEQGVWFIERT